LQLKKLATIAKLLKKKDEVIKL